MDRKVTKGNVFKDLGFTDEEAIALAMRVDLAVEIEKWTKALRKADKAKGRQSAKKELEIINE
jgi:hypothetical protein